MRHRGRGMFQLSSFPLFSLSQRSGWGARRHLAFAGRASLWERCSCLGVRLLASGVGTPNLASRWPRAAHASFVSCPESPLLRSGCRERLVRATSPTSRSCFYCTLGAGSVSQWPAAAPNTPPSLYAYSLALHRHMCMNFVSPSLFGDIL
ncbi:hypothetical protein C8F04DRAFT_147078 [Mycena alexandri]|uniref:Uncharacterized protein n=1 Tax=Mycena alexandri TaxID=1745969 RepID=A0AAD6X9I4_9AGAR|nr:hypothetical protein C8F04DRAFT_147078 [Mycena alexandri]